MIIKSKTITEILVVVNNKTYFVTTSTGAFNVIASDDGSVKSITDRVTVGFVVPTCEKKIYIYNNFFIKINDIINYVIS